MSEKEPVRRLEVHIDVDAPIEETWKAITTCLGIASWFAPIAEVSGPARMPPFRVKSLKSRV